MSMREKNTDSNILLQHTHFDLSKVLNTEPSLVLKYFEVIFHHKILFCISIYEKDIISEQK